MRIYYKNLSKNINSAKNKFACFDDLKLKSGNVNGVKY